LVANIVELSSPHSLGLHGFEVRLGVREISEDGVHARGDLFESIEVDRTVAEDLLRAGLAGQIAVQA